MRRCDGTGSHCHRLVLNRHWQLVRRIGFVCFVLNSCCLVILCVNRGREFARFRKFIVIFIEISNLSVNDAVNYRVHFYSYFRGLVLHFFHVMSQKWQMLSSLITLMKARQVQRQSCRTRVLDLDSSRTLV